MRLLDDDEIEAARAIVVGTDDEVHPSGLLGDLALHARLRDDDVAVVLAGAAAGVDDR